MRHYKPRKCILVTGGAGFLGSHLIDRLLARGDDVVCADNLFTGTKQNIEHLHDHPRFEFIRHDVTFPLYIEVDEIYNLACPASPIHYQHDPVQTTKTSVHGAINVLGLAKRLRARIFQASTSEVYGDPSVHPQTEAYWGNVNPIGPRSCYDEGKRCAETLFFDYHRQHGLDIRVARIFNTYGPRMHPADGRVVSNFIVQALRGDDITLYGTGAQTRSFCYVDDLIEGFLRFMDMLRQVKMMRRVFRGRSTSEIQTNSAFFNWPKRSSTCRAPDRRLCSARCLSTTRCSASPTSRVHGNCWIGSQRCSLRPDCGERSSISTDC